MDGASPRAVTVTMAGHWSGNWEYRYGQVGMLNVTRERGRIKYGSLEEQCIVLGSGLVNLCFCTPLLFIFRQRRIIRLDKTTGANTYKGCSLPLRKSWSTLLGDGEGDLLLLYEDWG